MSNVKKELMTGVFWSAVEKYSSQLVGIVVTMILSRLLLPSDFGIVTISTVIIGFLYLFCSMGIGPAIVQRENLSSKDLNNIFTSTIFLGILMSILLYVASDALAEYFKECQLASICKILTVSLFFSAVNIVPNAMMMRHKRFKDVARRTFFIQLLTGVISVFMAFSGFGVYTLVISPVMFSILIFVWNSYYYRFTFHLTGMHDSLKKIASFSFFQFLFQIVNYFTRNLDKIIIGRYISADNLGFYEKSYRLMQMPMQNFTMVISPVLQPILKDFQYDSLSMAKNFNKIVRFISTISFPLGIIMFFSAKEIVLIFYGENWWPAVSIFSVLALSIPTTLVVSPAGAVFQSINATKQLFWIGLVNAVFVSGGFFFSAFFFRTIESIAWSWTVTSFLCFFNTYFVLYICVLRTSICDMFKELISPIINALILVLFFYMVRDIDGMIMALIIKVLGGGMITAVFIQSTKRYDLLLYLKNRKHH